MPAEMFERMAAYNTWANRRLYAACAELEDAYYAPRPAFFGSIHRTLNHLLVADRIWMGRLEGVPGPSMALDTELYAERHELRRAREAEDGRIARFVAGLDEASLGRQLVYRNLSGHEFRDPVGLVLQHVFNHQTHHRGQVHGLLSGTPVAPPPLDLILYVREGGDSAAQAWTNSSRR
jgi:uncharacterized damage-inducible protein DinB